MEEYSQFLNLIPEEEKWHDKHKASEEKKLELRLGPPGDQFHGSYKNISTINNGGKRVLDGQDRYEGKTGGDHGNWLGGNDINHENQCKKFSSTQWSSLSGCCSLHSSTFQGEKIKEIQKGGCCSSSSSYLECSRSSVAEFQCPDKKKVCPSRASASFPATAAAAARDGTNGPHKRVAPAPVVGWPPVRSFRKNLASSSNSKLASDLPNKTPTKGCNGTVKPENFKNDLFVKINMEGVPIGRKINLNAYDSYEKLSIAIDELFRGLLAAQRETCAARKVTDEAKENSGVGIGEYTLVYEDNEGDRILVGDIPWHMFVSAAKRLRVLKSSQLSSSRLGRGEQGNSDKTPLIGFVVED